LGASAVSLRTARAARRDAELAVARIREAIEARSGEFEALVEAVARVGRIAAAITTLRGFSGDHFAGWEFRTTKGGEVSASLGMPIVDVQGFGASAGTGAVACYRVRRDVAR